MLYCNYKMHNLTGRKNLVTKIKVQKVTKRFQHQRRTKRREKLLQLFVEKIVINLPRVKIVAKPEVILAMLENKTAVRTDGVLTAVSVWLPSTDSNRGPGG